MRTMDPTRRLVLDRAITVHRRALQDRADTAARNAPEDTGATKRSVKQTRRVTGNTISGVLEFTTPQAGYTDRGTRPHVIRARKARALSFYWPKAGRRVAFRQVNHPGSRKHQGWFSRTVTPREWSQALTRALRGF